MKRRRMHSHTPRVSYQHHLFVICHVTPDLITSPLSAFASDMSHVSDLEDWDPHSLSLITYADDGFEPEDAEYNVDYDVGG